VVLIHIHGFLPLSSIKFFEFVEIAGTIDGTPSSIIKIPNMHIYDRSNLTTTRKLSKNIEFIIEVEY